MYKWILNKREYHWLAKHLSDKPAQDISFFVNIHLYMIRPLISFSKDFLADDTALKELSNHINYLASWYNPLVWKILPKLNKTW